MKGTRYGDEYLHIFENIEPGRKEIITEHERLMERIDELKGKRGLTPGVPEIQGLRKEIEDQPEFTGLTPSWGQRGNQSSGEGFGSKQLQVLLGNTARSKIITELFLNYTVKNGRVSTTQLAEKTGVSRPTVLRVLRLLKDEGLAEYGSGGNGHCLDGTSESGERFILALAILQGATEYDNIMKKIELQRFIRDRKHMHDLVKDQNEDTLEAIFRLIGFSRPPRWLIDHISDEHRHYIIDHENPQDSRPFQTENRHTQWQRVWMSKGVILSSLEVGNWMSRKELFGNRGLHGVSYDDDSNDQEWKKEAFGVAGLGLLFPAQRFSNSRVSQILSELVRDGLIVRKRGEKRGEMLYTLTLDGAEYAKNMFPNQEGSLEGIEIEFVRRTMPYGGSWMNKP